jgi:hypothetical protein
MSTEQVKVIYNSKDKIIVVSAIKNPNVETMMESVKQFMKLSTIHSCESILIDATRVKSLPSTTKLYSFGTELLNIPNINNLRFSFAISDDISESFRFFNNVLANRGLNIHTFKDLGKAKDWLQKKL